MLGKGSKTKRTVAVIGVVVLVAALVGVVILVKRGEGSGLRRASPFLASSSNDKQSIHLESFIRGELSANRFNGSWVSGKWSSL